MEGAPKKENDEAVPLTGTSKISLSVSTVPNTQTAVPAHTPSPTRVPMEFMLRLQTQMGRLSMHVEAEQFLPTDAEGFTLTELDNQVAQMNELHRVFLEEHSSFEASCPPSLRTHDYFRNDAHMAACRASASFHRAAAKIRGALLRQVEQTNGSAHQADAPVRVKLPNIPLPTFGGDYAKWPTFVEFFTSLVLENSALADVEKLHYLRGCLEGPPLQLVTSLPLTGASLTPSMEILTARYENRRLHIQSHLDVICGVTQHPNKSSSTLSSTISTVSEARTALRTLGITDTLGECLLVHLVSRTLDRSTKELWETALGVSQDYPSFDQLEKFLTSRARALERVEITSASTSSTSKGSARGSAHKPAQQNQRSAHQASSAQSSAPPPQRSSSTLAGKRTGPYPCDLCNGAHYIVSCAKFRSLGARERRQMVVDKRLCFNCLGRHSARDCKSERACKECSAKHHTMLHGASTSSDPSQSNPASAGPTEDQASSSAAH